MRRSGSLSDMSLQQLNEMNEKAKKLCDLMKQGIVEFIFKKKSTGKIRTAHGTLKRDLIPKEAQRKRGRPKKRPEDLVIYYDVDKQAIRSFKDYLLQKVNKSKLEKDSTISKTDKDVNSSKRKDLKDNKHSSASKNLDKKDSGKQNEEK